MGKCSGEKRGSEKKEGLIITKENRAALSLLDFDHLNVFLRLKNTSMYGCGNAVAVQRPLKDASKCSKNEH